MSDIPSARAEIADIADRLRGGTLTPVAAADLLDTSVTPKLFRSRKARQAPIQSRPMNRRLGNAVRLLAATTNLTEAQIAARVNINPGRVSEALNGRW